jgi:MFS family permease
MVEITPSEMASARQKLYHFTFFNIIAFTLLSGNTITLFSLRLGAGNLLIGVLSVFIYISYLCMSVGKLLVRKYGIVGLMGRFWFFRHLMMIPIFFAPLAFSKGFPSLVYGLIVLSVLGYNVFRGIAVTGYNPVIGEIVEENQRGAFLSKLQKIQHAVTFVVSIVMALVLGRKASLYTYLSFILIGIIFGGFASLVFSKIPEPVQIRNNISENLWKGFNLALKRIPFRKFIIIHFLISLATFMITPFLIVYVKKIYNQPDNFILIYTVFGSLGAILMAQVSGFMIDRLGAKPLYFIFTCTITLAIIPTILSPEMKNPQAVWIFSAAVFFFHYMGSHGTLNSGQTYFFTAITPQERLNLGVAFFLIRGLGGGIGALSGGFILQWLQHFPHLGDVEVFRTYFLSLDVFFIFIVVLISKMENLGAYPIRDVLAVIFSPREIRTISLLKRLDRSRTISEEKRTIRALAASKSELSVYDILQKLKSPRFTIRKEALTTLSTLPIDETVVNSLISEVKNHSFTTAHLAADIIGKRKITEGIPILRKQLHSKDYFLSGKCMVSLARLNDRESLPVIEDIVIKTANSHLIVHGAVALEIFMDPHSISTLLSKLSEKNPPYMRDEIILSITGILGFGRWFYPIYISFLEKTTLGISHLKDFLNEKKVSSKLSQKIDELFESLPLGDRSHFAALGDQLLEQIHVTLDGVDIRSTFQEAIKDAAFTRLDRFCFLVAALITWFAAKKKKA